MYYPYLRAKQFELLALREFAEIFGDKSKLIPIIEPVKKGFNSLKTALLKMDEKGMTYAVILNPKVGELISEYTELESFLFESHAASKNWIPAFIVTNKNSKGVYNKIESLDLINVLLICQDNVDYENQTFVQLIENKKVASIVINGDNRSLRRRISRAEKNTIRIDDQFNVQKKNSDYLFIPEEQFTEEHKCYKVEGFYGFADYTVLDSNFADGGRLPYAVAMHFTYEKNADEIWIRHFVSDTNDDNTNIQGKFGEAAEKAVNFFNEHFITSTAVEELKKYYADGQYPGLGVLKKLSIKHHLELINSVLSKD